MHVTYSYRNLAEAKFSIGLLAELEVQVTIDTPDELHGEPVDGSMALDGDRGTTWSPTGGYGRTLDGDRPTAEYQEVMPSDYYDGPQEFEPRLFHWDLVNAVVLEWVVQ